MAIENLTSSILQENIIRQISYMSAMFQAIGGLIIAYIIFNVINIITNRKKEREIRKIRLLLEDINKKLRKK